VKVYLSGPMRGLPNFNHEAFISAAERLRTQGHAVFNPVEETIKLYGADVYKNNPQGIESIACIDTRKVFLNDLSFICLEAEAIALLPGWRKSKGAKAEYATAKALGLKVIKL